jgi:hypothetical protein
MKFSEIHSLNFHLEDFGGAKWKFDFFLNIIIFVLPHWWTIPKRKGNGSC